MTSITVIMLLVPLAVALGLALIIGIILVAGRRRPQRPGWSPTQAGGAGTWNGEVLGGGAIGALGGTAASTFGLFRLEAGVLAFVPDDPARPGWRAGCHELAVGRRGLLELDGADLRVMGPMGDLRCNVSTERINRMGRNTLKDLRERSYAQQFVEVLLAHGARPL